MNHKELEDKCKQIRSIILKKVTDARSSHVGSMLSIVEMMVYLFYKRMNITKDNYNKTPKDMFILSKGHASLTLYSILNDKNIIDNVNDYCKNGECLIGHVSHKNPGADVSTGALGHGLSIAAGIALGYKIDNINNKVYCLLGDGECNEGSIWEALIFIANHNIKNLTIIIDGNKLQGLDFCENILPEKRLINMLKATNLTIYEINGHDFNEIKKVFNNIDNNKSNNSSIIFMHTIKGKGVSFMENKLEWHYKNPDETQLKKALEELK